MVESVAQPGADLRDHSEPFAFLHVAGDIVVIQKRAFSNRPGPLESHIVLLYIHPFKIASKAHH
jgi:hypothetical protein